MLDDQKTCAETDRFLTYTLQVNTPPYTAAADRAFCFAEALLRRGHRLRRVFFYRDGVYHALAGAEPPADEPDRIGRWSVLAERHGVDLVVCSAAAQRRGVWRARGARGLAPGFRVAGLALLAESVLDSDRWLSFG
ncbi:tRNA 2-thiouridine synthesizing protein D [Methylomarinovum tepidoasis]|uniref:tRNA 2-thiouridine synthesizing protein D n=1 Tax=Methylomarinovum tepidoasis TaxID=2840183 RepID=A0AAU9C8L9_9GAMM|nr:sulfurtransferase complex subunit TusD [Methylomarinovum sp. IN45]BCX88187.1 tRNA 2-thiouridine synthesizing protein D [Methylomarinovum sp. IN45]